MHFRPVGPFWEIFITLCLRGFSFEDLFLSKYPGHILITGNPWLNDHLFNNLKLWCLGKCDFWSILKVMILILLSQSLIGIWPLGNQLTFMMVAASSCGHMFVTCSLPIWLPTSKVIWRSQICLTFIWHNVCGVSLYNHSKNGCKTKSGHVMICLTIT